MKPSQMVLAVLSFLFSLSAIAISLPVPSLFSNAISAPRYSGGFFVGGTAMLLQPSLSKGDLDFAILNHGVAPNFSSEIADVNPGYTWVGNVFVGYIIPNTANDLTLTYTNINVLDDTGLTVPVNSNLIPINDNGTSFGQVSVDTAIDLEHVDLTAGHTITVGHRLRLHPVIGVSYLDMDRKLDSQFVTSDTSCTFVANKKSYFHGVGPLAAMDTNYYIWRGFGLAGHINSGLILGNMDAKLDLINTGVAFEADKHQHLVPFVEGKLGIDYTYFFGNITGNFLALEAGYQMGHYFRIVDSIGTINGNITDHQIADLSLKGPYISLVYYGDFLPRLFVPVG